MNTSASAPLREDELFAHALTLPAAERAVYLAEACRGDTARLANVTSLLAAYDGAASEQFMSAALLAARPARRATEQPGDQIGRYFLLEEIGAGGCGRVFRAEQREPVRREVALKVIKQGMDTAAVIARFEAERQALALMEHPGIARVFDAGATDSGRPFFVMELVRGSRITDYCDAEKLPVAARLRLFVQVCRAVQHAHEKGVIHRDLKPSNILVTVADGAPLPKVIDFGIAKATFGRLTDATLLTAVEDVVGTPAYMSPEHVAAGTANIDTRSDIYALGVVLYELLTGQLPFGGGETPRSVEDVRRAIQAAEPARPSHHVPALRGDLDWIVLKCLEKDRARRYDSAATLAADIERHLADQPVSATAPTMTYLAGKFIRRHRVGVAFGSVIVALLVGGLTLSTWLFLRERRMLERARYSEQKAVDGFRAALKQQSLANQERARAADVLESLAAEATARGDARSAQTLRAEAQRLRTAPVR